MEQSGDFYQTICEERHPPLLDGEVGGEDSRCFLQVFKLVLVLRTSSGAKLLVRSRSLNLVFIPILFFLPSLFFFST